MNPSTYKRVEDEYYRLRGQFDTDRLNHEQFDAALRELMIQDEQGRYWMIGADSGQWYFYDGTKWVQSDPYSTVASASSSPRDTSPILSQPEVDSAADDVDSPQADIETGRGGTLWGSPEERFVPKETAPRRGSPAPRGREFAPSPITPPTSESRFPFVPVLVAVAVIVLAFIAALFLGGSRLPFLSVGTPRVSTPLFVATITRGPSSTVVVPSLVALAPNANARTTPTVATDGVAIITPAPVTVTPELPTITPLPIPSVTEEPTEAGAAPVPTQIPAFPPGVYVTELRVEANPRRNQPITFRASFLNTTGEAKAYDLIVLIYDPNKAGPNKGFGETESRGVNVPPGARTFAVTYQGVKGGGGCIPLYAQAHFQDANKNRTMFVNTNGEPAAVYFDVCP